MSENMEREKAKRTAFRQLSDSLLEKVKSELNEMEPDVEVLEDLLDQLAIKEPVLLELDSKIEELTELDKLFVEIEEAQQYQEKISLWKSRASRKIKAAKENGREREQRKSKETLNSNLAVKLPRLTLGKFFGDASKWQEFWSQYETAIHTNPTLTEADKFNYLKSYLGGSAASAVNGLALTDENYQSAIQILTNRFGRRDIIVNSHMNKLLSLSAVKKSSDVGALRRLYDSCEVQIRSLQSVGVISDSYGSLFFPILMRIIPDDITLEYSRMRKADTDWDISDFLDFLRLEVESRERAVLLSRPESERKQQGDTKANSGRGEQHNKQDQRSAAALNVTSEEGCAFCGKAHLPVDCREFTVSEKKERLKRAGRCFVCLAKGHLARRCKMKLPICTKCGRRHHCSICDSDEGDNRPNSEPAYTQDAIISHQSQEKQSVMLQTVKTRVQGINGSEIIRGLLDGGSSRSFIREDLSRRLRLPIMGTETLKIHTFGNATPLQTTRNRVKLTLKNVLNDKIFLELEALETPVISSATVNLPDSEICSSLHSKGIKLSDLEGDKTEKPAEFAFLIGSDAYWRILTGRVERITESLVAMDTLFGWTLQGPVPLSTMSAGVSSIFVTKVVTEDDTISERLRSFWEIEHLGIKDDPQIDIEGDEAMQILESTICKKDGRYEVSLPWKTDRPELNDNFELAKRRLEGLKGKFKRNILFYRNYNDIFQEQLEQGIIEIVNPNASQENGMTYYLPHHGVSKQDRDTTKLRIVYDASSHENGCASLNDCLLSGPNLNPNLLAILLRFRRKKIALTADIEKAFLQISLTEKDRDVCRFLWFKDSPLTNPDTEYQVLRMTRVLFGATSSPFLLAGTIRHHLTLHEDREPKLCETIKESLYVDDFISGADDESEAQEIRDGATKLLASAGMNLRKWRSNFPELLIKPNQILTLNAINLRMNLETLNIRY